MIINFLGDSITAGGGAKNPDNKYVERVKRALNCTVRNYGEGGTRIARQKVTHYSTAFDRDFQMRAPLMEDDADYVFVFGGTNDFGHGDAEIGDFDSRDPYTYYGGIHNLINILIDKYGKEKLTFIIPLRRFDELNPRGEGYKAKESLLLEGYVNILKEVLDSYNIPYIDFFNNGCIPTPIDNKPCELFSDGIHPSDLGHMVIAQGVVAYVERMEYEKKQAK